MTDEQENQIHERDQDQSLFSNVLMFPFKFLAPPVLNTPISTITLPHISITTFLVFVSYYLSVGGFVYCYVNKTNFFGESRDRNGQYHQTYFQDGISSQNIFEAVVVGAVYSSVSCIAICAYYALTSKSRKSFTYKMLYRIGCTFPIWLILSYELFALKAPHFLPGFTL